MKRGLVPRVLFLLVAGGLLASCAALNTPPQPADHWQLAAPASVRPSDAPLEGGLLVGRIRADSSVNSTGMLYRETDFQPRYYANNRWIDLPTRQLQTALVEGLDAMRVADTLVRAPTNVSTRYRLDIELLTLEHDYRRDPPEGLLRLRVLLTDQTDNSVLRSRLLTLREPMEGRGPAAGVAAQNRALATALSEIEALLTEAATAPD